LNRLSERRPLDMKRCVLVFVLVLFASSLGHFPVQAQDKPGQAVTVTAVEVPVRVLIKGEPVKNLTKEDFEVYENGVRQEITAFEAISRRISPEAALAPGELAVPAKPRLFVLLFHIFDYGKFVEEGIDYFFQDIFHLGDQLIILAEDRVLNVKHDDDAAKVSKRLKDTLKSFKSYSTASITRAYMDLSHEGEKLHQYLQGEGWASWHPIVSRFYDANQRVWNDYKRQFFTLDLELYRSLVQRIRTLPGDKWVFCFEQRQMFPKLRRQGPLEVEIRNLLDNQIDPQGQALARQIQTMQLALQKSMDIVQQFPGDRLRELFMQAGITFHHIMMKSPRVLDSQDFELTDVGQDYEDCYRRISVATGGAAVFSNKVAEAIKEASVKEDYRYLLAYSPQDPSGLKERKIDIKVKRQGVDVVSLKQYVAAGRALISIADFKAGQKAIKFGLKNYARIETGGKTVGSAAVRIVIFNDKSEQVFTDGKTLELIKDETNISLNFPQLGSGSYFIIIDVLDRTTGGKDVYSSAIRL
jgi:VWFA-related protein